MVPLKTRQSDQELRCDRRLHGKQDEGSGSPFAADLSVQARHLVRILPLPTTPIRTPDLSGCWRTPAHRRELHIFRKGPIFRELSRVKWLQKCREKLDCCPQAVIRVENTGHSFALRSGYPQLYLQLSLGVGGVLHGSLQTSSDVLTLQWAIGEFPSPLSLGSQQRNPSVSPRLAAVDLPPSTGQRQLQRLDVFRRLVM